MASRSVNSGGSIKARKGNGAERLIAYNLMLAGYEVTRLDDNTAGIDLKAVMEFSTFYIEVKFHQKFSYNEIKKICHKTRLTLKKLGMDSIYSYPIFAFKSNRQPWLVASLDNWNKVNIQEFEHFFNCKIQPIPKGYKVWKENKV